MAYIITDACVSCGSCADVSVDDVLAVALGDSLNGALICAGTASNTSVGDDISHDKSSQSKVVVYYFCS